MKSFLRFPGSWVLVLGMYYCQAAEFIQAIEPRTLKFPQDHGSHAGFQTEWWYFTGNLKDNSGLEFGYQFTIFRRAADTQSSEKRGRKSRWAADDIYIGHLAISDIEAKQFYFKEESRRGVLGIANATDASSQQPTANSQQPAVSVASWEMLRTDTGWKLLAKSDDIGLELITTETMPPVAHGRSGEEGLSRKGPNPGQASFYYSAPQLKTSGTISIKDRKFQVSGVSWMDHEFGSNQLSTEQAGWDWFSIQLDDGRALMLYLLRRKDGSLEPSSSGTWIEKDGKATYVPLGEIKATPGKTWTSAFSNGEYPLEWRIEIPSQKISLNITPAQQDQEVKSAKISRISYYEGAIHVSGNVDGKTVTGNGYLEITGAKGQKAETGRGLGGLL